MPCLFSRVAQSPLYGFQSVSLSFFQFPACLISMSCPVLENKASFPLLALIAYAIGASVSTSKALHCSDCLDLPVSLAPSLLTYIFKLPLSFCVYVHLCTYVCECACTCVHVETRKQHQVSLRCCPSVCDNSHWPGTGGVCKPCWQVSHKDPVSALSVPGS